MKFVIKGPLPGLNELIEAERRNRYLGAQLKKKCETVVMHAARQLGNVEFEEPVYMIYRWYETGGGIRIIFARSGGKLFRMRW